MNFISAFLEWTKFAEPPESYFRWAAIGGISATLRDNVYHEHGVKGRLYPNLFILNVGPPAIGKQMPLRLMADLVASTNNTRVIAGSASMQAVIKALGTHEAGGLKGASCLLYTEELASFYATEKGTNILLTDMADYHENWERLLISYQVKLKKVCVTLLAASNEPNLKTVFDQIAVNGGLLSRTILNIEHSKRRKDAMLRKLQPVPHLEEFLKSHLKCIAKLRGPIKFDEEAEKEFEEWYDSWDETQDQIGIAGRMKTHVKKVAFCLAMAEENLDLNVKKKHVDESIDLCIALYKNYRIVSMESGKSPTAEPQALILRALCEAKDYRMSERVLLRRYLGSLNIQILTDTVPTMELAELVQKVIENNETTYVLLPKAIDWYLRKRESGRKK